MAIKLDKVSYQDKLKNISYEFTEGKITTVISSSGSGKTLLSYLISRIEKPTSGIVTNTCHGREMGYIFQKPHIIYAKRLQNKLCNLFFFFRK